MENHEDPHLAEAIARRDESRAQILRNQAVKNGGAYQKIADDAAREAAASAAKQAAEAKVEPVKDPEGTMLSLSDSQGNFAPNADVANAGGIGINASNTDARTAAPTAGADLSGTVGQVGDAPVIPADWKELSWPERRSLASKFSDKPINNGDEANAAIEAELKRRG